MNSELHISLWFSIFSYNSRKFNLIIKKSDLKRKINIGIGQKIFFKDQIQNPIAKIWFAKKYIFSWKHRNYSVLWLGKFISRKNENISILNSLVSKIKNIYFNITIANLPFFQSLQFLFHQLFLKKYFQTNIEFQFEEFCNHSINFLRKYWNFKNDLWKFISRKKKEYFNFKLFNFEN